MPGSQVFPPHNQTKPACFRAVGTMGWCRTALFLNFAVCFSVRVRTSVLLCLPPVLGVCLMMYLCGLLGLLWATVSVYVLWSCQRLRGWSALLVLLVSLTGAARETHFQPNTETEPPLTLHFCSPVLCAPYRCMILCTPCSKSVLATHVAFLPRRCNYC